MQPTGTAWPAGREHKTSSFRRDSDFQIARRSGGRWDYSGGAAGYEAAQPASMSIGGEVCVNKGGGDLGATGQDVLGDKPILRKEIPRLIDIDERQFANAD